MKVVVDTNVLVSAFLNPYGTPSKILHLILQGDIYIVLDERIIQEYKAVLLRPVFKFSKNDVMTVLDIIKVVGIYAPAYKGDMNLPDKGDKPFAEVALAAKADVIITGNKRHFPEKEFKNVKIKTPAEFISLFTSAE